MQIFKNPVNRKILVVGDLHGVWRHLNALINKLKPERVFQVGDFGWWPKFHNKTILSSGNYRRNPQFPHIKIEKPWNQFGLLRRETATYFCPGNHEDWEDLDDRATSDNPVPIEVATNLFFMPRCSVLKLQDGRNVLFIGGGHSIDKSSRIPGIDWFPNELISQRDILNLPEVKVDIVISHVCPTEFKYELNRVSNYNGTNYDPSCDALSVVLKKYKPDFWFFGHYHRNHISKCNNTTWVSLNKVGETGWWTYLPEKGGEIGKNEI